MGDGQEGFDIPVGSVQEPEGIALTAENVSAIVRDCLYRDEEVPQDGTIPTGAVIVEGVMSRLGFHPERLARHKAEIRELLLQLPEPFRQSKGGGWSFLNACYRQDGVQWGEHADIDALVTLGLATGQVSFPLVRPLWEVLPGGMPYFTVLDQEN